MSGYTVWQYTEADMTLLANEAKEQILFALENEGLLKGDAEEISRQYVIVLYKKNFFGSLWDRFRGIDKGNGLFFAVLKSIPSGIPSEDEEEKAPHLKVVPTPIKKDE